LGTITTGTWNGTKIGTTYGGTGLTTYTTGDILYASASDTLSKLAAGTAGQVLTVTGGVPVWGASTSSESLGLGTMSTQNAFAVAVTGGSIAGITDLTVADGGTGRSSWTQYGLVFADTTTSLSQVGIGTSGQVLMTNASANGYTWGSSSTSAVDASGNVSASLIPTVTDTYDLGSASKEWNNIYVKSLTGTGTLNVGSISTSGNLTFTTPNSRIQAADSSSTNLLGANRYAYSKPVTITNSSASTLTTNTTYTLVITGSDAAAIYSSSQADFDDVRIGYNGNNEITRIIDKFTSSEIYIRFAIQADIAASGGTNSLYAIYWGNIAVSAPTDYTGSTLLDSANTASDWTTSDGTKIAVTGDTTNFTQTTSSTQLFASGSNMTAFSTTSQGQLPQTIMDHSSAVAAIGGANYLYIIGGATKSTVYKATIDASGNIGTFATTGQGQLPSNAYRTGSHILALNGTNYIYTLGGHNGSIRLSTVYKATIDASGNIGTFATTSQGQLPQVLEIPHESNMVTIGSTTYVYVIGGYGSSAVSTVYKATIDASGNIGTFATTSQGQLPATRYFHSSETVTIGGTTYVYVIGGGGPLSTVYKATIDASGNIGTFATTSQKQLPQSLQNHSSVVTSVAGTNYLFVIGGAGGTGLSTVYKATIDASGNIGTFATTSQGQLPIQLAYQTSNLVSVGGINYIYTLGGQDQQTYATKSTVYRSQIGGAGGTGVTVSRDLGAGTTIDLTGKNMITFWSRSPVTGDAANTVVEFSEDNATWQTSSALSLTTANTWEQQYWDISGIANAAKDAIRYIRFRLTGDILQLNFDLMRGESNFFGGTTSSSLDSTTTFGNNLYLNTEGGGILGLNYNSGSNGDFNIYNGATTSLFTVKQNGNVGIGTTNPQYLLDVNGTLGITGASSFTGAATFNSTINLTNSNTLTGVTNYIQANKGLSVGAGTTYYLDQSGNLSANTGTFASTLGVTGLITASGGLTLPTNQNLALSSGAGTYSQTFTGTTTDAMTVTASSLSTGTALTLTGPTSTGVTDHFVKISSDIGAASSLLNLNPDFSGSAVTGYGIYNLATDATANGNTNYGYYGSLTLTGNAAKTGVGLYSTLSTSSTTADTLIAADLATSVSGIVTTGTRNIYGLRSQPASTGASTGGTTNVYGEYVKSGGTVGVGGTINSYGLYVANGTMNTTGLSTNTGLYVETPSGADTNYAAIFAGGNVGIGTTAPAHTIDVVGDAGLSTGTLWTNTSDSRVKQNIETIPDALGLIARLKPSQYMYTPEYLAKHPEIKDIEHYGFIAQDFQEVFPESISTGADGFLQVNASNVIPYMTKAIQELLAKFENHDTRIKDLEDRIASGSANQQVSTSAGQLSSTSADIADTLSISDTLNLTPPSILLSTISAQLVDLAVTSEATFSGKLTAYEATISDTFKSLGETFLGNTTVAGNFNIDGTMNISGNSLSTLGDFYIQNGPLAGIIDIFNGKIIIDGYGNITTSGQVTTQKVNISESAGQATLLAGQNWLTIMNTLVTENSLIFITPTTVTDKVISVTQKNSGSDFTVQIQTPSTTDIKFNWWIIN
jgi:hypothetical protein